MNLNRAYGRYIAREKMKKQKIKFKSDFFKENWRRLFRGDPLPLREDKR